MQKWTPLWSLSGKKIWGIPPLTPIIVTLGPGVRLDLRFLRVASLAGLLLLPPATQICGKRVFGVAKGIDGVCRRGGTLQADSVISRQGSARLMLLLERVRLGSRTTYAAPEDSHLMI